MPWRAYAHRPGALPRSAARPRPRQAQLCRRARTIRWGSAGGRLGATHSRARTGRSGATQLRRCGGYAARSAGTACRRRTTVGRSPRPGFLRRGPLTARVPTAWALRRGADPGRARLRRRAARRCRAGRTLRCADLAVSADLTALGGSGRIERGRPRWTGPAAAREIGGPWAIASPLRTWPARRRPQDATATCLRQISVTPVCMPARRRPGPVGSPTGGRHAARTHRSPAQRLTGPVEALTTSSGSKSSSSAGTRALSIWAARRSTTARPIASIGWRSVVSGGSVQFIRAESS